MTWECIECRVPSYWTKERREGMIWLTSAKKPGLSVWILQERTHNTFITHQLDWVWKNCAQILFNYGWGWTLRVIKKAMVSFVMMTCILIIKPANTMEKMFEGDLNKPSGTCAWTNNRYARNCTTSVFEGNDGEFELNCECGKWKQAIALMNISMVWNHEAYQEIVKEAWLWVKLCSRWSKPQLSICILSEISE